MKTFKFLFWIMVALNITFMAETNSDTGGAENEKGLTSIPAPAEAVKAEEGDASSAMSFETVKPPVKYKAFNVAYHDAFTILREDNSCSRFYGGSAAIEALNELVLHSKSEHLPPNVGFRQSGQTTKIINNATGLRYRVFEKAVVNNRGAFFRKTSSFSDELIPNVGRFPANSREGRVLILLHELAHLIEAPDGSWLIPDDGRKAGQSERNTELIEKQCRAQIKSVVWKPQPQLFISSETQIALKAKMKGERQR